MWPNNMRRFRLIISTTVSVGLLIFWFLHFFVLSSLVTPSILLRQLISIFSNFRSSYFLIVQRSAPYGRTGITSTWYTITLVLLYFFALIYPHATRFFTSFIHLSSSVNRLPRYVNSLTCSSLPPSSHMLSLVSVLPNAMTWIFFR